MTLASDERDAGRRNAAAERAAEMRARAADRLLRIIDRIEAFQESPDGALIADPHTTNKAKRLLWGVAQNLYKL